MNSKKFIWLFVTLIVVLPALAFAAVRWYQNKFEALPVIGGIEHRIGDFKMINARGIQINLSDWNNKVVVANFFFTHCPVVCPKMINNLKKVQNSFRNDTAILINSFTVDPQRDTARALAAYAQKLHIDQTNWNLLTGKKKDIYRLARKSFLVTATDGDGGDDDFIHADQLILIDGRHRIRGFYSGVRDSEVQQLINDIRKLTK
jgi:protein SCO1